MNEVYEYGVLNSLRFIKRAIGIANRLDSGAFPFPEKGFEWKTPRPALAASVSPRPERVAADNPWPFES
ncbi:MAG: hypothetical protein K0M73_10635 [Hydrogenophaga sp.]|nr:hypothetical protein [Hydrogenophaga sp.]